MPSSPLFELRVSLGSQRPAKGERYRGMVYLHAPGPRPKVRSRAWDAGGLPLWFLTPAQGTLSGFRTPLEEAPASRRNLKGWARRIRPVELNVELSDLGTVLQARYLVPGGTWLHVLLAGERPGEPPARVDELFSLGAGPAPPCSLALGPVRYDVSVEPQPPKEGP